MEIRAGRRVGSGKERELSRLSHVECVQNPSVTCDGTGHDKSGHSSVLSSVMV